MPDGDKVRRMAECGLDCYARDGLGKWVWAGSRSPYNAPDCDGSLTYGALDGQEREYRVYLPTEARITRLQIGSRKPLRPLDTPDRRRPIAYYGSSIVQGGCVARPGMLHASQVGRILDREILNLGCAGRAKCEPVIAQALARLEPACYLVDCLPNNTAEELLERLPPFLTYLRQQRPEVPIMVIEDRLFGGARFQPQLFQEQRDKNRSLHQILAAVNDPMIRLAAHHEWFGVDGDGTYDCTHPIDLGAYRMAQALAPQVSALLAHHTGRLT